MRLIKTLIAVALIGGCITASATERIPAPPKVPCPLVKSEDGPCYDDAQCNYEKCMRIMKTAVCYDKYCAEVFACDGGGGANYDMSLSCKKKHKPDVQQIPQRPIPVFSVYFFLRSANHMVGCKWFDGLECSGNVPIA